MFGEIKTFGTRKRAAEEPLVVQDFSQKENVYALPEKKVRQAQTVCLKCLAGDGGHITHVLSSIPKTPLKTINVFFLL